MKLFFRLSLVFLAFFALNWPSTDGFCCNMRPIKGYPKPGVCASCKSYDNLCCGRTEATCNSFCCNCDESSGGCIKGSCFKTENSRRRSKGSSDSVDDPEEGEIGSDMYPFQLFMDVDVDQDDRISLDEYTLYMQANRNVSDRACEKEFEELDRRGKGHLVLRDIDEDAAKLAQSMK